MHIQGLKDILRVNRELYGVVVVYSITISLLSLVIPIAAQSLVNVVSFGTVLQPVLILSLLVLVSLSVVAGVRIAQAFVVETMQQRLFVDIGIKLATRLPEIDITNFDQFRVTDQVNRFFEVQTIQKSLAIFLVTGIELLLLSFFSMVLIAFYHPILLAFDIVLVLSLITVIWVPWHGAFKFAQKECEAKHSLAGWLEEIVHNVLLFKMQEHGNYALVRADQHICTYLKARKQHFRYFIQHIIGLNVIYVMASAGLLGIGGYLVIKEQLSLGQLVASEIVVNALLYGFVRFGYYLEDFYDLIASTTKLNTLLTIEREGATPKSENSHLIESASFLSPPEIRVENLQLLHANSVAPLNFSISSGEKLALLGTKGSGKSLFIDILLGLRSAQSGFVSMQGVPIKEYNLRSVRKHSALIRGIELFSGTIIDNLVMQNGTVSPEVIHEYLNLFELAPLIHNLSEGLDTLISGSQHPMTYTTQTKLMIIRALISKPSLIFIDSLLDLLDEADIQNIVSSLKTLSATVIIATQRKDIASLLEKRIEL